MLARLLGRSPRTVTRGRPYRACTAHTIAAGRAGPPRRPQTLVDPWLWQYVRSHRGAGCSPEQIAGRLRREYPATMERHLSTEPIYAALSILPRGTLRREVRAALRQGRTPRRPRVRGTDRRGQIPNRTLIAARPAEVGTRTVPGHWEGDLIQGARNRSAIGTRWSGRPAWSSWPR